MFCNKSLKLIYISWILLDNLLKLSRLSEIVDRNILILIHLTKNVIQEVK